MKEWFETVCIKEASGVQTKLCDNAEAVEGKQWAGVSAVNQHICRRRVEARGLQVQGSEVRSTLKVGHRTVERRKNPF